MVIYNGSSFIDYAFTSTEKSAITETNVVNDGGNNTLDKVYLLSYDEVTNPAYGFISRDKDTNTRRTVNTAYVDDGEEIKGYSNAEWWLRSPGDDSDYAVNVDIDGSVYRGGINVITSIVGVRPALHLNLSSTSSWSYAGKVNWKGEEISTVLTHPTKPATVSPSKPSTSDFVVSCPSVSSKTVSFLAADKTKRATGYEVKVYKVKDGKKVKTLSASNGVHTNNMSFSRNTPYKYRVR
ncbi:MAG: hypothetical protein HFG32_10220 [Eubacterium sp.]|nr:hypothetical protein [Eubacterium sp.]